MSEEYGPDIVTLTDEEGVEHEFEHIDTIELNSKIYVGFIPANIPEDSEEEIELVILKSATDENGEEMLVSIDDESELDAAYEAFMEQVFEDEEE